MGRCGPLGAGARALRLRLEQQQKHVVKQLAKILQGTEQKMIKIMNCGEISSRLKFERD